jgi:16S rRNA (uracil1498-N3)-methyltransferase
VAHWQQVVISACEQCGRARVPTVNPPIQLSTWIGMTSGTLKWVMHHQANGDFPSSSPESIDLLIGPEGGLSDEEVGAANVAGFQSLQLGPRVLRTETAPVVALSVIAARWGDFE